MSREEKRNINNNSNKDYNLNVQMKVPELKKWSKDINPDWPTDDKRITSIGQNGNTGEHYEKI
jgi:hypothetical protein